MHGCQTRSKDWQGFCVGVGVAVVVDGVGDRVHSPLGKVGFSVAATAMQALSTMYQW